METRRWVNQSQPQTMVIAVFLLYLNAVFTLILGGDSDDLVLVSLVKLGLSPTGLLESFVTLVFVAGGAAAGYLIANEKKWGYRLGLVVAALPLAAVIILVILPTMNHVPRFRIEDLSLVSILFDGALFALLLHPQSRDYERIWFK